MTCLALTERFKIKIYKNVSAHYLSLTESHVIQKYQKRSFLLRCFFILNQQHLFHQNILLLRAEIREVIIVLV